MVKLGVFLSFVLALPTYWILLNNKPTDQVSSFDHAFAITALTVLPLAAIFGLFGIGFAAFAVNRNPRERWLTGILSLPALVAAGLVLYILANIPPT